MKDVIRSLADLRNKLAHSLDEAVFDQEAEKVREALLAYLGDDDFVERLGLNDAPARTVVKLALFTARDAVRGWAEHRRKQREEELRRAAFLEWNEQRKRQLRAEAEAIREQE